MHLTGSKLIISATDASSFLSCPHLTTQDLSAARGGPKAPKFDDPGAEVLRQRGHEHEATILEGYRAQGLQVAEPHQPSYDQGRNGGWARCAAETLEMMRAGADVVYQACLFDGRWLGRPDFLIKVDRPSALGEWSYEVVDAKLSRSAKVGAVLQICCYSEMLEAVQGIAPDRMHLALGGLHGSDGPDSDGPAGASLESFRVAEFAAYYRSVKRRFLDTISREPNTYPEPCDHCTVCKWLPVCDKRWRADDHLSLVAGISRKQRGQLEERGVTTLAALGRLPLPLRPPLESGSQAALKRVREQARIQLEGREADDYLYELFPDTADEFGLGRLPLPSKGDLFFDIESDPHVLDGGLEYLFGYCDADRTFDGLWALDRVREKAVFEGFIDMVMARRAVHPDLHIYHFGAYETGAVKRLMGRHATREHQVDQLLRGGVFVDLHRVVKQSMRASVESYSIKKLEPLFNYEREVDLRTANSALAHFEAWLALGESEREESELLRAIEGYNKDDCISTLVLRDWLEERRRELERLIGCDLPRPEHDGGEAAESVEEDSEEVRKLYSELLDGVPDDAAERTPMQQGRWVLANLLSWHRREDKSTWWEYFRCVGLDPSEFIEDRSTLGGLQYEGIVEELPKSFVHRYRFPHQRHAIETGGRARDPETDKGPGTVMAIDDVRNSIDIKRGKDSDVPHPSALLPLDWVDASVMHESLMRLAHDVVDGRADAGPRRAAMDLLVALAPRCGQASGDSLVAHDEGTVDAARRLVHLLDNTVLPIQGPPGAGKTYTGARMILELLIEGKRVGIAATGHKVISNLLNEVCDAASAAGVPVAGVQKATLKQWCERDQIERAGDNAKLLKALTEGPARLAAGTSWLWARPEMEGVVDVLFVDEAGQMSLANVLAMSQAASSLVLLGDPRQLEQPQQGVHPPDTGVSALEHLVGASLTMPADRGLFLPETWRLSPSICAFTSEVYYEGRLRSREALEALRINGPEGASGTGLRVFPVEHTGNTSESPEEVTAVRALVSSLSSGKHTWVDNEGSTKSLTLDDVLVVAPYNAQVALIKDALPEEARVGTVDKFQGQQAAIVVFSATSSSAEDAPHGMDFLYNPNRLNVATSRARCLAIIVASPALFAPACRSVRQMSLANGLCRFQELAEEVET